MWGKSATALFFFNKSKRENQSSYQSLRVQEERGTGLKTTKTFSTFNCMWTWMITPVKVNKVRFIIDL